MSTPAIPWRCRFDRALVEGGHLARLSLREMKVLYIYVFRADERGVAYPGAASIAEQTGISESNVRATRRSLVEKGIMVVETAGGGAFNTTRYRVLIPGETLPNSGRVVKEDVREMAQETTPINPPRFSQNTLPDLAHKPSPIWGGEHSIEHSIEHPRGKGAVHEGRKSDGQGARTGAADARTGGAGIPSGEKNKEAPPAPPPDDGVVAFLARVGVRVDAKRRQVAAAWKAKGGTLGTMEVVWAEVTGDTKIRRPAVVLIHRLLSDTPPPALPPRSGKSARQLIEEKDERIAAALREGRKRAKASDAGEQFMGETFDHRNLTAEEEAELIRAGVLRPLGTTTPSEEWTPPPLDKATLTAITEGTL